MDEYARSCVKSAQNGAYSRRALNSDSEVILPTLVHVPGVEIEGRYSTKVLRMRGRQAVTTPHAALKKPRVLQGGIARIVHLGGGKTLQEVATTVENLLIVSPRMERKTLWKRHE